MAFCQGKVFWRWLRKIADAEATFRESTLFDMGRWTRWGQRDSISGVSPKSSGPRSRAGFFMVGRFERGMEFEEREVPMRVWV